MPGSFNYSTVYFNYTQSRTLVDNSQIFVTPPRDVEFIQVPGRNGDLSIDNGRYENIEVVFRVSVDNTDTFRQKINALYNTRFSTVGLNTDEGGYKALQVSEYRDSENRDYYRLAQFVSAVALDTRQFNVGGEFELTFNCKPQLFLYGNYGDVTQNQEFTSTNWFEAKPRIQVYGNGTLTLTSSRGSEYTHVITVANNTRAYLIIDSELEDCYFPWYPYPINMNSYVTFSNGFPVFGYGTYTVTWTGFTRVSIEPRYWVIA